jgi:hypothetical protein
VVYGVGRAWLFKVDVQNTPIDSEFFRVLGNAEIVGGRYRSSHLAGLLY